MKIEKIISQHRRDMRIDLVCQDCNARELNVVGYDDAYFHNSVIPHMKCKACGKSTIDLGIEERPLSTKYAEGEQV